MICMNVSTYCVMYKREGVARIFILVIHVALLK